MKLVLIQARMGSSRLPGKVLTNIAGQPLLLHLIHRLQPLSENNSIIVSTTKNKEDDAIADFCSNHSFLFSRGSDWDVLERFYQAALEHGAKSGDTIIRICADNPLHSHKVVNRALRWIIFPTVTKLPTFLKMGLIRRFSPSTHLNTQPKTPHC